MYSFLWLSKVNSGSWWWTGKPGVLWFMGSQRVGHDWATELNWTEYSIVYMYHSFLIHSSADGHLGCFHALAIHFKKQGLGEVPFGTGCPGKAFLIRCHLMLIKWSYRWPVCHQGQNYSWVYVPSPPSQWNTWIIPLRTRKSSLISTFA